MAIPSDATPFTRPLDPKDILDFQLTLTRGAEPGLFLQTGEAVQSFTLTLGAEAVAAGLVIRSDGAYAPVLSDLILRFWLSVASGSQTSALFEGAGVLLSIEFLSVTNSSPARTRKITYTVTVRKR